MRSRVEYDLGRAATTPADAERYYRQAYYDEELAAGLDPADARIQEMLAFYRKNIPEYASTR